jgi:hypothetical protein
MDEHSPKPIISIHMDEPVPPHVLAAQHYAVLMAAHRRGEHPYGAMRRDCPLCARM